MSRPRHTDKHIEKAVGYAESLGWRFQKAGPRAHAWGYLFCHHATRDGCRVTVWSTPRDCENHARNIRREVDGCPHTEGDPPA